MTEARSFPAHVASVLDDYTVVINRGTNDGIQSGQRFLVYGVRDEVLDPETGESLGLLEVVRGFGKATHVQDEMATLISISKEQPTKRVRTRANTMMPFGKETIEEIDPAVILPFSDPEIGDRVKPI